MQFVAQNISVKYAKQMVINNLDIKLMDGKITIILGPNGSGKSTLLKTLAGLTPAKQGKVLINAKNINQISRGELAKLLSILPQSPESPSDITVSQLVQYGRYAHSSWFNSQKKEDAKIVKWALDATNLTELKDNYIDELSGGERQRVWIAMSLAQTSSYLFLDEPTAYLDINFQFEILTLLKQLNQTQNKTIVMVLHEIQHALNYADYIVVLDHGKIHAYDTTDNIIKSGALEKIFKIKIKTFYDEGVPYITINNI